MRKQVETWAVEVHLNGERALSIGHSWLSGRNDIDDYKPEIRRCAESLLAFIGEVIPDAARLASVEQERDGINKELVYYRDTVLLNIIRDARAAAEKERDALRAQLEREKGERERISADLASLEMAWDAIMCEQHQSCGDLHAQHQAIGGGCLMCKAQSVEQAESALAAALEEVKRLKRELDHYKRGEEKSFAWDAKCLRRLATLVGVSTPESDEMLCLTAEATIRSIYHTVHAQLTTQLHAEGQWSRNLPNSQDLYWWWNEDGPPVVVSIMASCTGETRYFAAIGQHGWNRAQWVEDMGGYWMRCHEPDTSHLVRAEAKTAGPAPYQFADEAHRQRCEDFDSHLTKRDPDLEQTAGEEGE